MLCVREGEGVRVRLVAASLRQSGEEGTTACRPTQAAAMWEEQGGGWVLAVVARVLPAVPQRDGLIA